MNRFFFQKEEDNEEHMENAHTRLICKIYGPAITRKGDMATFIASMHRYVINNANVNLFMCPFEPVNRTFVKQRLCQNHLNVNVAKISSCRYAKKKPMREIALMAKCLLVKNVIPRTPDDTV